MVLGFVRCTVNRRPHALQRRSGRSPIDNVRRTPLRTVVLEAQYGHFGLRPRGILSSPPLDGGHEPL